MVNILQNQDPVKGVEWRGLHMRVSHLFGAVGRA